MDSTVMPQIINVQPVQILAIYVKMLTIALVALVLLTYLKELVFLNVLKIILQLILFAKSVIQLVKLAKVHFYLIVSLVIQADSYLSKYYFKINIYININKILKFIY